MCQKCGHPEASHTEDQESLIESINRMCVYKKKSEDDKGPTSSALYYTTMLLGNFHRASGLPPATIDPTDEGGLYLEWRSGNRMLEVEVFPGGLFYEFMIAQIQEPTEERAKEGCEAELMALIGSFRFDDLEKEGKSGEGFTLLAGWVVGGEYPEFLDRYLCPELESVEGTCLASEPGSEPPNTEMT